MIPWTAIAAEIFGAGQRLAMNAPTTALAKTSTTIASTSTAAPCRSLGVAVLLQALPVMARPWKQSPCRLLSEPQY